MGAVGAVGAMGAMGAMGRKCNQLAVLRLRHLMSFLNLSFVANKLFDNSIKVYSYKFFPASAAAIRHFC